MRKKILVVLLTMGMLLASCGESKKTSEATSQSSVEGPSKVENSSADNTEQTEGSFKVETEVLDGYKLEGQICTITKEGEYTLSGELTEGQLIIDANEAKVSVTFNGVKITNSTMAPVTAINAKELKLKSLEGSVNTIIDGRPKLTTDTEEELTAANAKAAIYAACDLSITGKGELLVTAGYKNGIHSKDDLSIKNVTLSVNAVDNALKGNDGVTIESGVITLDASEGDGIKADNEGLSAKGNQKGMITIKDGSFSIKAGKRAIHSKTVINIEAGEFKLVSMKEGIKAKEMNISDEAKINK